MNTIKIATIGFTRKSAQEFFETLRNAGVARVVDIRLNNESQLAGFTKKSDLEFFLKAILGIGYVHLPMLAPTPAMLKAYRTGSSSWSDYERQFFDLMAHRQIERHLDRAMLHEGCLLCSEHEPHHCHRRLVAEYFRAKWGNVTIKHLGAWNDGITSPGTPDGPPPITPTAPPPPDLHSGPSSAYRRPRWYEEMKEPPPSSPSDFNCPPLTTDELKEYCQLFDAWMANGRQRTTRSWKRKFYRLLDLAVRMHSNQPDPAGFGESPKDATRTQGRIHIDNDPAPAGKERNRGE